MTDLVKLLNEVKKDIRSLLSSTPIGLTAKQLSDDYYSFVRARLPYRELGYYGVEDMARDMPDVVQITWQSGQMIMKAVNNEETQRISSLVSKQRLSYKARKEQSRREAGTIPRLRTGIGSGRFQQRPAVVQHFVPAHFRTKVIELLKCYRSGIRLTQFEGAFSRRFGISFEWRHLGFSSLRKVMEYLESCSVVHMERVGADYQLYTGFGQMQTNQTVTAPDCIPNRPQHDQYYSPQSQQTEPDSNTEHFLHRAVSCEEQRSDEVPVATQHRHPAIQNVPEREPIIEPFPVWTAPDELSNLDELESDDSYDSTAEDSSVISPVMQKEIQKLLASKPDGIWNSRLPQEYEAVYKKELIWKDLGFSSVIQFVAEMADIIRIERPTPSDWLLFDIRIPPKETPPGSLDEDQELKQAADNYNEEFKEELRAFLLQYKDGILLEDLADEYKKCTGKVLDPRQYGFESVERLLLPIDDKYLKMTCFGNGQMKVSGIEFPSGRGPIIPESPRNIAAVVSPPRSSGRPWDAVMDHGVSYRPISLVPLYPAADRTVPLFKAVYVSNISNPHRFWLQLKGKKTSYALENLMECLDFYRTEEGDRYKMPESQMFVGQVCAAIFPEDGNWHRGLIVGIKEMDTVQIYFVDYGNTCSVQKCLLRLLRREYLQLECQAIQARLSHVEPPSKGWTVNSMRRMLELVGNKPVVADIKEVKDCVLFVRLVDTSTDEDVFVDQVLANEGFAIFAPPPCPQDEIEEDESSCLKLEPGRRRVKRVALTEDHTVHLVNYNDKPYLLSAEISSFFWESDKLRAVLRQKKLNLSRQVLANRECPKLFIELVIYNVMGMWDGQTIRTCITLYELSAVEVILEKLEHPSADLKAAIENLKEDFDPLGFAWYSNSELVDPSDIIEGASGTDPSVATTSVDPSEEDDESLSDSGSLFGNLQIHELQDTKQALQMQRKRLVEELMRKSDEDVVNQLRGLEKDLERLTAEMYRVSVSDQSSGAMSRDTPIHVVTPQDRDETAEEVIRVFAGLPSRTQLSDNSQSVQTENSTVRQASSSLGSGLGSTTTAPGLPNLTADLQHELLLQSVWIPPIDMLNQNLLGIGANPGLGGAASGAFPQNTMPMDPSRQLAQLQQQQMQLAQQLQQQQQRLTRQQLTQSLLNSTQPRQPLAPVSQRISSAAQMYPPPLELRSSTRLCPQRFPTQLAQQLQQQQQRSQQQLAQSLMQSVQQQQQRPVASSAVHNTGQPSQTLNPSLPSNFTNPPSGGDFLNVESFPSLNQDSGLGVGTGQMLEMGLMADLIPLLSLGQRRSHPPS